MRGISSCARSPLPDGEPAGRSEAAARTAISSAARPAARVVIPGLYDGHNRTFFFADYAGLKETRGPGVRQHRADRADPHRRLQRLPRHQRQPDPHLRSADHAAESGLRLEPAGQRHQPAVPARSVSRQRHPAEPHQRRRAERRQHLSAAERRRATSTTTPRPSTARSTTTCSRAASTTRSSDNDSFFVRFNWGKFKLDAPQGQAACCLPTPAEAAARFDLGPFVAGIQNTRLTTHGAGVQLLAGPVAGPRQRAARRLRADAAVHVPVRLRHPRRRLARHPRHQRHRVHDRPAEHQHPGPDRHLRRPGVPAGEPEAVPLADRGRARLAARDGIS